ncbi:putative permease of the major facilitator [Bradyrhizobium sp. ORS 285]|uniref:hypothetical protein n=1 Tax=Bradyrhizobium sp. ORS 285 TaxID=115808 RepID=UPI000240A594|nr:hypothetical protein [Bradyrhizobium sp. ORS 285]CCD85843.1 conserved membrane hypothetical protein [Bradyrhizobium sp. ORS 285]SMX57747.1 putative permease of the major facilitator [Bradyrhizobium sp. ORS 285]
MFWPRCSEPGDTGISNTQILDERASEAGSAWLPVIVIPLFLVAPALWNGYPLLQWDTGGYLARWYEGYLVPSRSTVFGLYLHYGEGSSFWLNLGLQALATLWILQLTLRVLGLYQPLRLLWIGLLLILTTALPWLASMLLTDIFAGLSVLALFLLVTQARRISVLEKAALFGFVAFASATHSATLGVLLGLCSAGWIAYPWRRRQIALSGLIQSSLTIVAGAAMLLAANFALSGQLAWTPGGTGVAFGRMLQDGIVAQYLNDHCGREKLKLCPYRNELPPTADDFLWGNSMFNKLGRFEGMNEEMGFIVKQSLAAYPLWQAKAAAIATGEQLMHVATGEGTSGWVPHTYGIIERYIPSQVRQMRAAHQQHWEINFAVVNWLHVPVALGSMLAAAAIAAHAIWRRRRDDITLLATTVTLALLGNAVICGIISGPHDRYGARLVWIATFTVLIAVARWFGAERTTQT